jgi:predicted ester cyclase
VDATPAEIARAYFEALGAHDLDAAVAVWRPGAIDRIVGGRDLLAPDGLREYFGGLFEALPDFALTVTDLTSEGDRVAVRWHATGTSAGLGELNGFAPNHGRIAIDGCDVCTVQDGLIVHNDAFSDSADVARQLGLLPADGSPAQMRLAHLAKLPDRGARERRGSRARPSTRTSSAPGRRSTGSPTSAPWSSGRATPTGHRRRPRAAARRRRRSLVMNHSPEVRA